MVADTASGLAQKVVVDAWFNSQQRPGPSGKMEYFHYKWNDTTHSGFSLFGRIFHDHGTATPILSHHVIGDQHDMGRIPVAGGGPLFKHPHVFFMKDTCTISVKSPAVSLLQDRDDILMATEKYGKGTVFAVADPRVYNEYTDGHNLPAEYDNLAGAGELVTWLLQQVPRVP
jgi:unsaturated rhamnogalacturonyl hydrolase